MKTLTETDLVAKQRQAHHNALLKLASHKNKKSGLELWRSLRRVECVFTQISTAYCNGESSEAQWEAGKNRAVAGVHRALGCEPAGLYINSDPRGYALKIDPEQGGFIPEGMHKDWGGYGILAPVID